MHILASPGLKVMGRMYLEILFVIYSPIITPIQTLENINSGVKARVKSKNVNSGCYSPSFEGDIFLLQLRDDIIFGASSHIS
jgi:hypothetical protein